jgi:hypothetical protein
LFFFWPYYYSACFPVLGPVLKLITNQFEKPTWVYLVDSSASVAEVIDSVGREKLNQDLNVSRQAINELGLRKQSV